MIPVIISGGSGSRLWPVSRTKDPKTFLKLANGLSLLQNTFIRAINIEHVDTILTITNEKLHFRIEDEYKQLNYSHIRTDFILEPFGKNTANAIIQACLFAKKYYSEDQLLLILPADHLISDIDNFSHHVNLVKQIAELGYIVTFGINPEYPETGYGYIEADSNLPLLSGFKVKRFIEKPNKKIAEEYIQLNNFFWNSGMFCAKVSTFLQELKIHNNHLLTINKKCFSNSKISKNNHTVIHLNPHYFLKTKDISIDYALLEKSSQVAVVPSRISWSDIGSWLSISQTIPKDKNNNAIIGENITLNTSDCLIYSTNRIIATSDVKNLIIVDTKDALLVADKASSQNVKNIFERLKDMAHATSELHQTVHRPWGTYTILEEGPFYKIKRIEVKPHSSLSLQSHEKRSEHWVVVDGVATITVGVDEISLKANQSTYIPVRTKHRLENQTEDNLTIIEIQCGEYLGEDDITRYEDKYGRTNKE